MKASELETKLKEMREAHGDIDVCISDGYSGGIHL